MQPTGDIQGPIVNSLRDLPEIRQNVVKLIHELEESWFEGYLHLPLACTNVRSSLGPVVEAYGRLDAEPDDDVQRYRRKWVQNALDEFVLSLSEPRTVFDAGGTDGETFVVELEGSLVRLRLDQAARIRVWGLGIEPHDPVSGSLLATRIARLALARLAGAIGCVGKMSKLVHDHHFDPKRVRWRVDGFGVSFEHLVVDILNEDKYRAHRATLFEDLFEWTDLRVRYDGLPRKNGARVQVKFIRSKEGEDFPRWRNIETHVVLNPPRLAEFTGVLSRNEAASDTGPAFWESLHVKPADDDELANAFFDLFDLALRTPPAHPLGPMAGVPLPVRNLVRRYVETESFKAAKRMVNLLSERPNAAWTWKRSL